jgi:GTP pyrophosphokinase
MSILVQDTPSDADVGALQAADQFVAQRLSGLVGENGESYLEHARGTAGILRALMADETAQVVGLLFGGDERLPADEIERRFGATVRGLVDTVRQVMRLRRLHQRAEVSDGQQLEVLRRMMLAMSVDVRVVLIRLASRLQTLRFHAARKVEPDPGIVRETLDVLAPLANRLGLWQLKWEIEDLAFRFQDPVAYRTIAGQLEEKRGEREVFVRDVLGRLQSLLRGAGIDAEVSGRPKHIYSIRAKMRSKALTLADIRDLRALRVIVADVRRCYEALSLIHQTWVPVAGEFDDYIARPKANGYQSLHTVVSLDDGRPLEIQIRTREMHHHAEYGVASHWAYKERSTGVAGAQAARADDVRVAWIRQLLAWQREVGTALGGDAERGAASSQIYALTPQGRVVELPQGSTPVDFAYHVHTDLGHRCRGARVDGHLVPLGTPLQNGQTVEILSARKDSANTGPSRDWLNVELGYVRSHRARAKVRQWFNARELEHNLAEGRARVERVLQREGRTALALEELAARLGFAGADELFVAVARDEVGPRLLEEGVRGGQAPEAPVAPAAPARRPESRGKSDGVLVVGVDLLMTQLARCCRPAPPDLIAGFVTRGRGVSVHRAGCRAFERMREGAPERVLDTSWGPDLQGPRPRTYPVDVLVQAPDRQGLLRDVSDVFARDRLNVIAVNTLSKRQVAHMQFTVEVPDTGALNRALAAVREVRGVFQAIRKPA